MYETDAVNAGLDGWAPTVNGECYGTTLYPTRSQALSAAEQAANDMKLDDVIRGTSGYPLREAAQTRSALSAGGHVLRLVHDADAEEKAARLSEHRMFNGG